MRIQDAMSILTWLVKYMQKNNGKELEELKKNDSCWGDIASFNRLGQWVGTYSNTKEKAIKRIEQALCALGLISSEDCSNGFGLRKPSLRALANLMNVKEDAYKVSSDDLEGKVSRFAKASV